MLPGGWIITIKKVKPQIWNPSIPPGLWNCYSDDFLIKRLYMSGFLRNPRRWLGSCAEIHLQDTSCVDILLSKWNIILVCWKNPDNGPCLSTRFTRTLECSPWMWFRPASNSLGLVLLPDAGLATRAAPMSSDRWYTRATGRPPDKRDIHGTRRLINLAPPVRSVQLPPFFYLR